MHNNPKGYPLKKSDIPPPKQRTKKLAFPVVEELIDCIAEDDEDGVDRLLEAGADVNLRDEDGMTPLHRSCLDDTTDVLAPSIIPVFPPAGHVSSQI